MSGNPPVTLATIAHHVLEMAKFTGATRRQAARDFEGRVARLKGLGLLR